MALPAGRYGVTKNQLLKIKKLPMNTIKLIEELTEKFDLLGSAAFKNSTSVVTDSSDLVESGAVYTALQSKMSYADNGVLGAKNRFPLTLESLKASNTDGSWSGNVYSINNVSFTVETNTDGSLKDIKVNGTASASTFFYLRGGANIAVLNNNKGEIINGSPQGGSESSYIIRIQGLNSSSVASEVTHVDDIGNGIAMPDTDYVRIYIRINNGAAMSNRYFYPMTRRADDSDPTYQPYAQTNRELTINKADNSVIAPVENGSTASQAYAVGQHFIRNGVFCTCIQAIAQGGSFTLNTNYVEGVLGDVIYRKYTKTITISANAQFAINIPTIAGYTPIQVTPASMGSGTYTYCDPIVFVDTEIFAQVVVRNRDTENSHTWNIYIGVTYVKTNTLTIQALS